MPFLFRSSFKSIQYVPSVGRIENELSDNKIVQNIFAENVKKVRRWSVSVRVAAFWQ